MQELEVTFDLLTQPPIEVEFELEEPPSLDAEFLITFTPSRVSELENDAHYVNETQLNQSITDVRAEFNNEIEYVRDDVSDLNKALIENVTTLDNKIDTVNQELTSDIDTLASDVAKDINALSSDLSSKYNTLSGFISTETNSRIQADNNLQNQINTKQPLGDYATNTRVNAVASDVALNKNQIEVAFQTMEDDKSELKSDIDGLATDIEALDGKIEVNTTNITSLNNTKANQSDLNITNNNLDALTGDVENLSAEIDTKQPIINDLSTIRSNAQAGKTASDTIATYGNIVTHNVSEFQPTGNYALKSELPKIPSNISAFNNDVGYLTEHQSLSNYYNKSEVDAKVSSVYRVCGSVSSFENLPKNAVKGDVYNVLDTGANYVWTGSEWDKLSETVDLTPYLTKNEASNTYQLKGNYALKSELPVVPTDISAFNNDSGYITASYHDSSKQDKLTAGNGIDISNNVISTNTQFCITEDMFDLTTTTKTVEPPQAPYNASYGFTNITIHDDLGIEWVEGAVYNFVLNTKVATSTYRNVRVRIGSSGDYKPLMGVSTTIAVGSSVFIKNINSILIYKSTQIGNGALHILYDTNTTYSAMTQAELDTGTATTGRTVTAKLLSDNLALKQNTITDLDTIRDGASKGATALQSVPSEYITETELSAYHDNSKQDKLTAGTNITIENNVISASGGLAEVSWGGITGTLSSQTDLKNALDGKQPTGDYALKSELPKIAKANTLGLVAGGNWLTVNQTTGKMECGELTKAQYDSALGYTFISKTTLNNVLSGNGYITSSYHDSTKQDVISDLATIRSGASAGATAIQQVKTINNESIVGSGNITIESGNNDFIAEYGVTTWQEVDEAYNSGKNCYCYYNNGKYRLEGLLIDVGTQKKCYQFSFATCFTIKTLELREENNAWNYYYRNVADADYTVSKTSNLLANARFDGQWVDGGYTQLLSTTSRAEYTVDVSPYATSNCQYEFLLQSYAYSSNATTSRVQIWSDIITKPSNEESTSIHLINTNSRLNSNMTLIPVGTGKKIYINLSQGTFSQFGCRLVAYRRLGTNA